MVGRVRARGRRMVRERLRRRGYDLVRTTAPTAYPPDFEPEAIALCQRVAPYTMTGPERIAALRDAVQYVVGAEVPGAIVECGVWRGGSMQAVALSLLERGVEDRDLFLFDTFGHMPAPAERDVDLWGTPALPNWERYAEHGDGVAAPAYHYLPLPDVRTALAATGYPAPRLRFIAGLVEDTIPLAAPEQIALLRLDTDWYGSTRHELEHLVPRMAPGGVVLVDDYGHFRGARDAVDEYLASARLSVYLHRIDYTGRLWVMPGADRGATGGDGVAVNTTYD